MTRTTINNINKSLKAANLPFEIVKEPGYFWFAASNDAPNGIEEYIPSIYSSQLSCMSVADYVAHVKDGVDIYEAECTGRGMKQNEALTIALKLAVTAPTEDAFDRAVELAVAISDGMTDHDVEMCKFAAEACIEYEARYGTEIPTSKLN